MDTLNNNSLVEIVQSELENFLIVMNLTSNEDFKPIYHYCGNFTEIVRGNKMLFFVEIINDRIEVHLPRIIFKNGIVYNYLLKGLDIHDSQRYYRRTVTCKTKDDFSNVIKVIHKLLKKEKA